MSEESKKPKRKRGKRKARSVDVNGLTGHERAFVEAYFQCWNATEAAARAKYKGNRVTLASVGYENLRKPQIVAVLKKRFDEMAMESEEVLARLTSHARGNLKPFVTRDGRIDMKTDEAQANLHLVKKYKVREKSWFDEDVDDEVSEVTTEIELHDPQVALRDLGRHHGLFVDKIEVEEPITIKLDK